MPESMCFLERAFDPWRQVQDNEESKANTAYVADSLSNNRSLLSLCSICSSGIAQANCCKERGLGDMMSMTIQTAVCARELTELQLNAFGQGPLSVLSLVRKAGSAPAKVISKQLCTSDPHEYGHFGFLAGQRRINQGRTVLSSRRYPTACSAA